MAKIPSRVPECDRALWREAVRGVTPLRDRAAAIFPTPDVTLQSGPPRTGERPASRLTPRPVLEPALDRFAGLDRANAERLKRGHYRIEARLDLHGMTQIGAHRELALFIEASHDVGRRCVLVITGRGLGPNGPGILKSAIPRWLEEPELRRKILAIAPAQPCHGGTGALYVLLRRRR